jgi:hypothetical protein
MLNPFPDLLAYIFFAPVLFRITVGAVFVYLMLTHFKNKRHVAGEIKMVSHEVAVWLVGLLILAEAALAAAFFLGFSTQIAALLAALGFAKMLVLRKKLPSYAPLSALSYVLLIVICLSILITGAGAFAFDLPL